MHSEADKNLSACKSMICAYYSRRSVCRSSTGYLLDIVVAGSSRPQAVRGPRRELRACISSSRLLCSPFADPGAAPRKHHMHGCSICIQFASIAPGNRDSSTSTLVVRHRYRTTSTYKGMLSRLALQSGISRIARPYCTHHLRVSTNSYSRNTQRTRTMASSVKDMKVTDPASLPNPLGEGGYIK